MPPVTLDKYFTASLTIARLQRLRPSPKTPVLDLVYPQAKQDTYPKSRIPVADLPSMVTNAPVVARGSASYAVSPDKTKVDGYEPLPIELETTISDAALNDLRNLTDENIQAWLDLQGKKLKDMVVATVGALTLQSLSGKLTHSVQLSPGVFDTYSVDFGTPASFNAEVLFDAGAADITAVIDTGNRAADELAKSGFDNNVIGFCGVKAFRYLVKLATMANTKNFQITVTENSVVFPGFTFRRLGSTYYDHKTKQNVKGVADNKIVFVGNDAPFWLPYCSLDNAEAGFQPLPFWFGQKRNPNGKGYILTGESKPFPVPIVKALVWATVTAA